MKKYTSSANEFLLHTCEAIGKYKKSLKKIVFCKNFKVQLMGFCYISTAKNCTSPANEFLL